MANFDDQVMGLTGLTINGSSTAPSQSELTQFLTDGAKEIINVLPPILKEKCMTETTMDNSSTTLDLDGFGQIMHVTRLSADSSGFRIPCRKIPSVYGELSGDSSNMIYYATATDPAYWITSSNDATILNVNPTPTANQTAIVYHVGYPSVAYNAASIANFPDEAEYIVVLYAACKSLQSTMGAMQTLIPHSDYDGDWNDPNIDGENQGWEQVRYWLEYEEDTEMSQATMSFLNAEMQQWMTEYQWYQGQYQMLKQDYTAGLSSLGMAKGQMAG